MLRQIGFCAILVVFAMPQMPRELREIGRFAIPLGNVIGAQITWDCTERRDMAMTELFERLEKDMLQLSNPNAGAQGHG